MRRAVTTAVLVMVFFVVAATGGGAAPNPKPPPVSRDPLTLYDGAGTTVGRLIDDATVVIAFGTEQVLVHAASTAGLGQPVFYDQPDCLGAPYALDQATGWAHRTYLPTGLWSTRPVVVNADGSASIHVGGRAATVRTTILSFRIADEVTGPVCRPAGGGAGDVVPLTLQPLPYVPPFRIQ